MASTQAKSIPFLGCLDAGAGGNFNATAHACATKHGIDFAAAQQCASQKAKTLLQADIMKSISSKLAETPWVVVAGKSYFGGADCTYTNLLNAICKENPSISAC